MFGDFLGNFENRDFISQTAVANFGPNYENFWATFYSNIWSHWLWQRVNFRYKSLRLESSHRQFYFSCWNDKNKEKDAGNGHYFKSKRLLAIQNSVYLLLYNITLTAHYRLRPVHSEYQNDWYESIPR